MPAPTTSSSTSNVGQSGSRSINALLGGVKWGGATGTGTTLDYSFPWTTFATASFSGHGGTGSYSQLNEPNATQHYGLSTIQQAAARSALQAWANVANVTFSEVAETASNVGDIRFAWTSATDTTSTGSPAWGWASLPNSYWPASADVWISTISSGATSPDWSSGSYNYKSLLHELGHALGLKHPFEGAPILSGSQDSQQYTVMSYTNHPHSLFVQLIHNSNGSVAWTAFDVVPDSPMLYDIAAMQYLYGPNLTCRTGNDIYTFDPNTPFFRTIWDAGGIDTISVSNFSRGCSIDLQPGHFSKITILSDSTAGYKWASPPTQPTYDGTDNLAIAFGCVIENAIGGSGNDTLIGNDANNTLEGGAGNDTIDGGAGTDTAVFSGPSKNYQLGFANGNWTVQDKTGVNGTDALFNMERLQFADKTVVTDSSAPGSYTDLPESLWQFCIVAFSAAPGVEYMNQMADAYRGGLSVQMIVDIFTSKSQFTDVYPANLSHLNLASTLVNNVVKSSASTAVKQGAINDIVGALDTGWTTGRMIYTVFGNLAGKALNDATWGTTAHQFQNELAVAKYYTNVMGQSTTDLSTLRHVLAPVDQNTDVSTSEHIATLVGMALMA